MFQVPGFSCLQKWHIFLLLFRVQIFNKAFDVGCGFLSPSTHTHTLFKQSLLNTSLKSMEPRFRANEINQIINLRLVNRHSQIIYTDQPWTRPLPPYHHVDSHPYRLSFVITTRTSGLNCFKYIFLKNHKFVSIEIEIFLKMCFVRDCMFIFLYFLYYLFTLFLFSAVALE